jgi:hypothetical protein
MNVQGKGVVTVCRQGIGRAAGRLLDLWPELVLCVDVAELNPDGAVRLGPNPVLHSDHDKPHKKLARLVPAFVTHIQQHQEKP